MVGQNRGPITGWPSVSVSVSMSISVCPYLYLYLKKHTGKEYPSSKVDTADHFDDDI